MNYLAHLHLGRHTKSFLLGSMLGDFVRGRVEDHSLPAEVAQGVVLHRKIDAWTDEHPVWQQSRARLRRELRRFAGIVIDVFYDHFLSRHWDRFSGTPLDDFIATSYDALCHPVTAISADVGSIFERMARENWLGSYGSLDGIAETLVRISRRSPRIRPIAGSDAELEAHYTDYEADFLAFYPDAIRFAQQCLANSD